LSKRISSGKNLEKKKKRKKKKAKKAWKLNLLIFVHCAKNPEPIKNGQANIGIKNV